MSPLIELPPPPPAIYEFAQIAAQLEASLPPILKNLREVEAAAAPQRDGRRPTPQARFTQLRKEWEVFMERAAQQLAAEREAVASITEYTRRLESARDAMGATITRALQAEVDLLEARRQVGLLRQQIVEKDAHLYTAYHTSHKLFVRMCALITVPTAGLLIARWLLG